MSFFSKRHHVLALVLVVLTVHFGFTLLYLIPTSPLKARLGRVIDAYMNPWFDQRWELFAPSPVNHSHFVMVACRIQHVDAEPPWHDISTPLLENKYAYRLTPADRLHRVLQASTALLLGTPRPMADKLRSKPDVFKDELARYDAEDAARERIGKNLVTRIASAHCDQLYGHGQTVAVKVRMLIRELPSFSRRSDDDRTGEAAIIDYDWASHQSVASL